MFIARIKGAKSALSNLRFYHKIMGALAALRRNYYPPADDGVFA
jgi:hypothetical protein